MSSMCVGRSANPNCVRTFMKRPVKLSVQFDGSTSVSDTLLASAHRQSIAEGRERVRQPDFVTRLDLATGGINSAVEFLAMRSFVDKARTADLRHLRVLGAIPVPRRTSRRDHDHRIGRVLRTCGTPAARLDRVWDALCLYPSALPDPIRTTQNAWLMPMLTIAASTRSPSESTCDLTCAREVAVIHEICRSAAVGITAFKQLAAGTCFA
jgi:hypothetical protein